jgi:adenylate cyclase
MQGSHHQNYRRWNAGGIPQRHRSVALRPDHTHHAFLAASSAQLGNRVAASAHAQQVLQQQPAFRVQSFLGALHYQQPVDAEHVREGLLKAGLPY